MTNVELTAGDDAPEFEAEISDGSTVTLSELLSSGKKVILYFLSLIHI